MFFLYDVIYLIFMCNVFIFFCVFRLSGVVNKRTGDHRWLTFCKECSKSWSDPDPQGVPELFVGFNEFDEVFSEGLYSS